MTSDANRNAVSSFSRPPKLVGAALLLLGVLVIGAGLIFENASPMISIAGVAMCAGGVFAFGLSWLVQVMNNSPRQEKNGPGA